MKIGFDNEKYVKIQSDHIKERIAQFGNKLYLELGGKLFDDNHASRVLPGFQPDSKLRMLQQLSDTAEIVIVIGPTWASPTMRTCCACEPNSRTAASTWAPLSSRTITVRPVPPPSANGWSAWAYVPATTI